MRNKGKQKKRLYQERNKRKIERNRHKKSEKRRYSVRKESSFYGNDFLGDEYKKVMKYLDKSNFQLSRLTFMPNRTERIIIPEVFSISENTEEVIRLLKKLYTIGKLPYTREIIFDHSNCRNLGLSASTIMDVIVVTIAKYREKKGNPLDLQGELPRNAQVRDTLLASGLPHHLEAESIMKYDETHVERFETIKGCNEAKIKKADETATKLTLYFNRCLKTQNLELKPEGNRLLSRIFGEVLSNCEIHGGKDSTWYTQGHYQIVKKDSYGEMQLLFLSIGNTIYEGLRKNSSIETQMRLEHMINSHNKYMSRTWDEEMVCTLFSLQEGISRLRDRNIVGYEGRGSGTVSMIEMFHAIGESEEGLKPQMTIISGSTKIFFSDRYKMKFEKFEGDKAFGKGEKRIIAFNADNDIYSPPDTKYVQKMKEYFPGTVISLRFYLDSRYITGKKGGK